MAELSIKDKLELRTIASKLGAEAVNLVLEKARTTMREVVPKGVHFTCAMVVTVLQDHEDKDRENYARSVLSVSIHDNLQPAHLIGKQLVETGIEMINGNDDIMVIEIDIHPDGKVAMSDPHPIHGRKP